MPADAIGIADESSLTAPLSDPGADFTGRVARFAAAPHVCGAAERADAGHAGAAVLADFAGNVAALPQEVADQTGLAGALAETRATLSRSPAGATAPRGAGQARRARQKD